MTVYELRAAEGTRAMHAHTTELRVTGHLAQAKANTAHLPAALEKKGPATQFNYRSNVAHNSTPPKSST